MEQASSRLVEQGVLGAILVILFSFIALVVFKYYLPAQQAVAMRKAELEAENQKQRDQYNQQQVDQLLTIMKEQQQRFDSQISITREEHMKAYAMQRDFFQAEAEAQRQHVERTMDKVCDSIDGLKKVTERSFIVSLAIAEASGRTKGEVLKRVETLTGESGLAEKYDTKGGI